MFAKGKSVGEDWQPLQRSAIAPMATRLEPSKTISAIGSETTIVGKLICKDLIKVYGLVEGELYAANALIADGARIEGEIVAEELTIARRVKGDIHALASSCRVLRSSKATSFTPCCRCTRTHGLKDARGRRTLHLNNGRAAVRKA